MSLLAMIACNDDNYNGISNSGEAKIVSFNDNHAKLITLNEVAGSIELIYPSNINLSTLSPSLQLYEGARVFSPENPEGPIDLSNITNYRIINGNIYHDYKILALHVSDIAKIESFAIGRYKGSIDHSARTIKVNYPMGESMNALTPIITVNDGAKLVTSLSSPHDFTKPVNFVISYMDETFIYTVSVIPTLFVPMAFLGEAASANLLSNNDEKKAWEWMKQNYETAEYLSFDDIKAGKDLAQYKVIWYHYDSYSAGGDPVAPDVANHPLVISSLNDYLAQKGNMFLSSAGMALGKLLRISKDGNMFNNAWGFDNEPFSVNDANGYGWGLRIIDHEIFNGLRKPVGETNRVFILSNGCNTRGHNVRWNIKADWTPQYLGRETWMETNGGKQLADMHWADNMDETSIITEYEKNDERGTVITCGSEAYDWYEDNYPSNTFRDNLELLTQNILNYLID